MSQQNTITTIRTIPYSINTVWNAWTNPETLKVWWGPNGFTNTFHEHDFREGGKWVYTMHAPEAGNFENAAWFVKIEKPSVLVWNRKSQPLFLTTVNFEKISDTKTRIVWDMKFETEDMYNKLLKFVPEKNEENLDRLEAFLKTQ
jgi:uncharacterized protein YndB with AHSA1/START domain